MHHYICIFLNSYETSDGQKRRERAEYKQVEGYEEPFLVVIGAYSWIGPDGIQYGYEYVADENGYRTMEQQSVQPPLFLPPNAALSLIG